MLLSAVILLMVNRRIVSTCLARFEWAVVTLSFNLFASRFFPLCVILQNFYMDIHSDGKPL